MRWENLLRWGRWLVLGFIVSLASASFTSASEWVLVDNFDASDRLNPENWFGSETRRPNLMLEAYRVVADGKLRLSAMGYGSRGSNRGRQTSTFGLGMQTTRPISAVQAELTVSHAMAQSCPENAESTQGRAQLVGFFFNDGSRVAKGDLTGDVVALMEKVVDSHDGNFIRALVLRCTSRSCNTGESIKALLFKRNWTLNETDVLRIEWEPSAFQFVFSVNPGAQAAQTRRIAYDPAMGPSQPAPEQRHRIRVRYHAANCESGRRGARMAISLDDVYLRYLDPGAMSALASETAPWAIE